MKSSRNSSAIADNWISCYNTKKDFQKAAMKKKNTATGQISYAQVDSLVGSEVELNGDITAGGSMRLEGNFTGNITISGNLVIGRNAYITGDLKAKNVHIIGTVDGNITAETLKILSTGRLYGDATVHKIIIDEGAVINGTYRTITVEDRTIDLQDILDIVE